LILDIGSGHGPILRDRADVVHADLYGGVHLEVKCDAHFLPFRDNAFKVVHASNILEHLDYPLLALREFKRVCEPNGMVIIKVPNARHFPYEKTEDHIYSWNASTLKHLLEKVFSEVKIENSMQITKYDKLATKLYKKIALWTLTAFFKTNELTAICKP
jgi:ubiquinone/menaquinone biosynthesis C-methylase UbiE